jgi:leucyl-tRNA synthetase
VTRDFEEFHYNTAVAAMMELVNTLIAAGQKEEAALAPALASGAGPSDVRWAMGEALRILIFALSPIAPHVGEEMWSLYGDDTSAGTIFRLRWPATDPSALRVDTETLVVQVNGKLRAKLELPTTISAADVEREARENPRIAALLEGRKLKKTIHVPHRLINLVVE